MVAAPVLDRGLGGVSDAALSAIAMAEGATIIATFEDQSAKPGRGLDYDLTS